MARYVPTREEVARRVDMVADLIIRGYNRTQIIKLSNNNFKWDVDSRTIDNYMRKARAKIAEDSTGEKKDFFNIAVSRYNDLYQKNYSAEDFKECRGVQDSLNKLIGINEPDKQEMEIDLKGSVSIKEWLKNKTKQ